jgi:hypothetical protein
MTFPRAVAVVLVAAALVPAEAAADVTMVSRDVPVGKTAGPARTLAARPAPLEFNMVGLHWRGSGTVWFRTAGAAGTWSDWQPAAPEEEDGPDSGSPEGAAAAGWKLGNPYWTGAADRIEYRLSGTVTHLRAHFVSSDIEAAPSALARPAAPAIIGRKQWGANESIVRGRPAYAPSVRFASVHHTAGTNSYTAAQSAAIVRGIQRYHVVANGWNDIGYNFLVSKHGQIFEGRAGGVDQAVIGAHARGFNTGSTGVAVLGTYGSASLSAAGRSALERLLAWRMDVAHVDPAARVRMTSSGNERFPAGRTVLLRTISGHRDTGSTTCPGARLYGLLGPIATSVAGIGLPKLYDPVVSGGLGGPVRFRARLSTALAWRVTVRSSTGAVVAQGSGNGTGVDFTWDSSGAPVDAYTYEMAAGPAVRPATGAVPGPPPLALAGLRAAPAAITPNGDRNADRTRISFFLPLAATVDATVLAGGALARTLAAGRVLRGGQVVLGWNGTSDTGALVPDGRYRVRIVATAGIQSVAAFVDVVVDRTLRSVTIAPTVFSPNGDRRGERITFAYDLARTAGARVRVLRKGRAVATLFAGPAAAGRHVLVWKGRTRRGRLPDGLYSLSVQATTSLGTRALGRTFRVDTVRPAVRIRSVRLVRGVTRVRFVLGEAGRVRIWYGRRVWRDGDSVLLVGRRAGDQQYWRRKGARLVRIVAWDAAGNASRSLVARVRR